MEQVLTGIAVPWLSLFLYVFVDVLNGVALGMMKLQHTQHYQIFDGREEGNQQVDFHGLRAR